MKALPSQFDDREFSSTVATPTCGGCCCCCCCCVATTLSASALLAQRIGKEGEKQQIPSRYLLTMLAALFMPIVGLLIYAGFWIINEITTHCSRITSSYSLDSYNSCTETNGWAIAPLLFIVPAGILWYLYSSVHIEKPFKRAALVTTLIVVAFTAEFFGGGALILFTAGIGGIFYLILIPFIIGWITLWYHRHLGKEPDGPEPFKPETVPLAQSAYPNAQHQIPMEQHEEQPSDSAEAPPEQKPPVAGA